MNLTNRLHIMGFGYLHEIKLMENKPFVRIQQTLSFGNTEESEEVWFHCRFASKFEDELVKLEKVVEANNTVFLHFSLNYKGFAVCYSGQTPEDTAKMVLFHAELIKIHAVYLNGKKLLKAA